MRWAVLGAACGALVATVAYAPAAWLAGGLAQATGQRVLLADARGTVWRGSAVMVLTGGEGSRDASALPDRLYWRLGVDGAALALHARQACCLQGELLLRVLPGLGRVRVELPGSSVAGATLGQWPASWLEGLGTPWNTLKPAGTLQFSSTGLSFEQVQGRWRFKGLAELTLGGFSSRLSTLDSLGSYRLSLRGDAGGNEAAQLQLVTTEGALQLSGSGQILAPGAASRLRFSGQASAAAGFEAALGNLLNIIGRRQGALSVISIG